MMAMSVRSVSTSKTMNSGTLYVVGTPIGNLSDFSPRGREVLGMVDVVLCEDTRVTGSLAHHLGIAISELKSYYGQRACSIEGFLALLGSGSVALVSDAGMPGISDPGKEFVAAARVAGHEIVVVPGPSALTAALALCPFDAATFVFCGFVPRKEQERHEAIKEALSRSLATVWYEAPHRIVRTLEELATVAPEREVLVARELTKLFEESYAGSAHKVLEWAGTRTKGEWVVVVAGTSSQASGGLAELGVLANSSLSPREAARIAHQLFGVDSRAAYTTIVELRNVGRKKLG